MREGRTTDSWVDQTSVIGRDEDKKTLISKLINEQGSMTCGSGSDTVPIIFILGMGGLGKTTLAKSIFNDKRVEEHFGDKRMWVCVGEVFDRKDIMKSMIKILDRKVDDSDQLREQLAKMLKDRLYLLILDDVWNENYLEWEPLLEILNQGAKGSRIVITTRNTGVEANIGSAYTHKLKGLDEDKCLSIFKKVAVGQGKEEECKPLMDIGREIVGKCGGLPLAVKTIASAVRHIRPSTREQWEKFRDSKIWDLKVSEKDKEGILPALMLSYTELTPQLKNCFSYCSIFEKDTILEKDELIKLWVSQGYTVVNDPRREEEEVGEECFDELLARSMFQEPESDEEGGSIARCKMHDLIHDLAQLVTKEECRVIISSGNDDANNNNNARASHCVVKTQVSLSSINLAGFESFRTLIYIRDPNYYIDEPIGRVLECLKSVLEYLNNVIDECLKRAIYNFPSYDRDGPIDDPNSYIDEPIGRVLECLKSVRVLILRNCNVRLHEFKHLEKLVHLRHLDLSNTPFSNTRLRQLPASSIRKLKELLYLDLSRTHIETLPENIGTLSSLRQLKVENCGLLKKLPKEIVSLPHLQVINLKGCSRLEELPEGIFAMANLRRLNIEGCSDLKKLPNGIGRQKHRVIIFDRFRVVAASRDAGGGGSSTGGGGCGGSSNIRELGGMKTGRHLDICYLKEVGSRDEARTAKLEEKTDLNSLTLSWLDGFHGMADVNVAADGVLEGLRPPPQLLELNIRQYPGQTFPGWMGDGDAFHRLRQVYLSICNCTQLPPLGQLPSLERLTIVRLDEVERVGREFFSGPLPTFPRLTELEFQIMENWSKWVAISDEEEGSAESPIMPALERLEFFGCPKLEAMPRIFTASLRKLTIEAADPVLYHSPMLYHSSLQFLPKYKTIRISGAWASGSRDDAYDPWIDFIIHREATELPGGLLHQTALRMLKLVRLPHLNSLPEELTQLTALQQLLIEDCPELSGRCQVGGELWPKIAHIPHIKIDGQDIQCLT